MATYDLGKVVGDAGEKGDDGSTLWNTSTAPTYANSKYTFTISNLSGKTGLQIAVNDIIFYSTYYYIVSAVNSTTVDCSTRVSIKGSDASVTIVDNLTSTSSTSALSAKQGKVLNDNKIETSSIATSFGSTPSDSKVASEKLTKNTLDTKVDKVTGKGLSTNDFTNSYKNTIDGLSTVATTGDYDDLTDKPTIPSKISDLTNDSDFIETSSTSGLIKNDGTVDTTSYSTFSGSYNDLSGKPTIPSASTTTPSADTTSGSYGSGTSYARSNHTHPKSSLYAEATHSHTKSQISDFPTIPTKTSDLTNDGDGTNAFLTQHQSLSNYVQKSSTTGLIKNDGSIDTNTYLTQMKVGSTANYIVYTTTNGVLASKEKLGNINYLGRIGSTANKPLITTTNGTITTGSFGTTANSFCEGNDSRLSDARTPTAHTHTVSNITDFPALSTVATSGSYNDLSNKPSIPSKTSDLTNDGADGTNVFVANNDSRLSDARTPTSHTHGNLTNDGKVGSTANYFVYTTTSGAITSKQKIGNITTGGAIGSTSGLPIITTSSGVLTTGSFGTGSGTFAEGNHTHSGYVSATKVTSWQSTPSDSNVPSEKLVKDYVDGLIGSAISYIVGSGS